MGYIYINQKYAQLINEFYQTYFNDYLNYHRPCGYAKPITDKKGKDIAIPSAKIAYVEIGSTDAERRIGFGD